MRVQESFVFIASTAKTGAEQRFVNEPNFRISVEFSLLVKNGEIWHDNAPVSQYEKIAQI